MARPQFLFESLDVVDFGLVHDALGMANSANFGVGRSTHGLVLGPGVEGRHGIDRPEHSWHVRTSSSHDVSIGRLGTLASIHGGGIVKGSLSWCTWWYFLLVLPWLSACLLGTALSSGACFALIEFAGV
jgi:hypothetical protein